MCTASRLLEMDAWLRRRGAKCWWSSARSTTHRTRRRTTWSCIATDLTTSSRSTPTLSFSRFVPYFLFVSRLSFYFHSFVNNSEEGSSFEGNRAFHREKSGNSLKESFHIRRIASILGAHVCTSIDLCREHGIVLLRRPRKYHYLFFVWKTCTCRFFFRSYCCASPIVNAPLLLALFLMSVDYPNCL